MPDATTIFGAPTRDGIHSWVPEDIYHADRGSLSVSGAKLLLPPSCPAKFRQAMTTERKTKREFDFGHVAHRIVLGKGAQYVTLDPKVHGLKKDGTPADNPRATASWKAAEAAARERRLAPIHVDDHTNAKAMAKEVLMHPIAGPIFASGTAEVSLYHTDPETGIRLRGRVDWITSDGEIDDYKTAVTANPDELWRTFYRLSYFMQAAWYMDLAVAVGAVDGAPRFRFIVQEKEPPYLVSVIEYDDDAIAEGRRRNREAIRLYAQCCESGCWPGYSDETVTISLPGWAFPHPPTLGEVMADSYLYDTDPLEDERRGVLRV